ncbi:hypothetical protein ACFLYT_02095, partial [Nanoarchaeota archaeon]
TNTSQGETWIYWTWTNPTVNCYDDDGTTTTPLNNAGPGVTAEDTGPGSGNLGDAMYCNGTKPFGVMQQADGDGNEQSVCIHPKELDDTHFLPVQVGESADYYVAIIAAEPNTNCTVTRSGAYVASQTSGSLSYPYANQVVFIASLLKGDKIECNASVMIVHDDNDNEMNLFSLKASRRFVYPTPEVTVGAEEQPPTDAFPSVSLDQPTDNYINDSQQYINITFNATATDDNGLLNCSLWHNISGTFALNQTQLVSGLSDAPQFTLNLTNTSFIWNIGCYDDADQLNFSEFNRTVTLNWTAPPADNFPSVSLDQPTDNYINDSQQYINITFNATATDDNELLNCSLWHNISGTFALNQTQLVSGTTNSTGFSLNLTNTTFIWNIYCYDTADQLNNTNANRTATLNWTPTAISTVAWNQSTLALGTVLQGTNKTNNVTVISTESNTNVVITNVSGNGTFITAIPTSLGSMTNTQEIEIRFNCSPPSSQTPGYYETIFNVNSTQDTPGNNITVNCTVSASIPYWSDNQTEIVSTFSPITQSFFNITWLDIDSISTVFFESDYSGTISNFTMNIITGDVFNYSDIFPAGTYYWKSYANDSANQWNQTDSWSFTIDKAPASINLLLNSTDSNFTIERKGAANITAQLIAGESTIELYQDNILINSGTSPLENISTYNQTGVYNITTVYPETSNYSASSETHFLTVNDSIPPSSVTGLDNQSQ